jgi:hypothetical protein
MLTHRATFSRKGRRKIAFTVFRNQIPRVAGSGDPDRENVSLETALMASDLGLEPANFVLQLELLTFEFGNRQIVGTGMRQLFFDLHFQCLMLCRQLTKMRLKRHLGLHLSDGFYNGEFWHILSMVSNTLPVQV